jgi:hypothetical protein
LGSASALAGHAIASVVEEDAAHDLCRYSKKVRTILPPRTCLAYQPQVGLVDQCRGLERVPRPLTPHVPVRDLAQFPLDKRQQIL